MLPLLFAAGCDRGQHPTDIEKPAPDFAITDGGRDLQLSSYRGKVVVLNFWASWCLPCLEEFPSLDAPAAPDAAKVAVLGVSTDEDAAAYHQFLAEHRVGFVTIRDASQRSNACLRNLTAT